MTMTSVARKTSHTTNEINQLLFYWEISTSELNSDLETNLVAIWISYLRIFCLFALLSADDERHTNDDAGEDRTSSSSNALT